MNKPSTRSPLVDDEDPLRGALRFPFLSLGFQVAEATGGEQAFDLRRVK